MDEAIIAAVLRHYPEAIAVYLFGGYGTPDERPESDVDLALLLPAKTAKEIKPLVMSDLHTELEEMLGRKVDLINLRRVDTVFQHEIIQTGRTIYCRDQTAVDNYEMVVMGLYQKLNEERAEIIADIIASGKIL